MKKLIIILTLLSSIGSYADALELEVPENEQELDEFISDLKNKKIPQLDQIHTCFLSANLLTDIYQTTKSYWVSKAYSNEPAIIFSNEIDSSIFDINIYKNFEILIDSEKEFETKINAFIQNYQPSNLNKQEIQEKLKELDAGQTNLANVLLKLSIRETMFLYLVNGAKTQLKEFDSIYAPHINYLKGESCENSNVSYFLLNYQDDIKSVSLEISKLRNYVTELREKRNLLLSELFKRIRKALVTQYANLSFEDLESIQKKFIDIIKLDNLGQEMITWWQNENANGLAGNLHLKYLQYQKPLHILRRIDAKILAYETKILRLDDAPKESIDLYLKKLKSMKSTVSRNLSRLEKAGWQGQKDRQVLINSKRLERSSRYSNSCIQAINKHLEHAQKTEKFKDMLKLEMLYRISVDACSKR